MTNSDRQPEQRPTDCDVLIIGAGPAGLALAVALAREGMQLVVVDQQAGQALAEPAFDGREIAINHASKGILQALGIWPYLADNEVHPLQDAKVENGDSPYVLHFERSDHTQAPLGYLIANHCIRRASYQALQAYDNVRLLSGCQVCAIDNRSEGAEVQLHPANSPQLLNRIRAALVVGADSRFSSARRMVGLTARMKDFGKVMMVCNMRHELDHRSTAQEIFQYGGTCAVLPLGPNVSSIVITNTASRVQALESLEQGAFNREMERLLGGRLGAMTQVAPPISYPLVGAFANRFISRRFALIGDAAVGMHPVTAHGYNLGLRSADTLAAQVGKAWRSGGDIGSSWLLHQYEARHILLSKPLYEATNLVVGLYTNDQPLARVIRTAALRASNHFAPFKQLVVQRLIAE